MNNVILIGNLTKDVEVRWSTGEKQTAVGRFTLAVSDGYGEKKHTSFLNIVCFGKTAENSEKYLAKGSKCCVRGHIQTGSYEGKNGKIYTTDIIADEVEFLGKKTSDDGFTAVTEDEVPW